MLSVEKKKINRNHTIIELENVWKIYKMGEVEVPALRGMSFKIKEGEFVSIIGASGSGKSTTMNMIGCLDIPTKGKVFLDGQNIARLSESRLAQIRGKKIGFIFQTFNLIPSLSALENVMLPMTFQKVDKDKKEEKAKGLLELVGLEKRSRHKPSEMSGGERQRVAIARALANEPELILADEPTGNLDSVTGKQIMEMLINLNKLYKRTVVIVTHDLNLAKHAEKIIKIKDGRCCN